MNEEKPFDRMLFVAGLSMIGGVVVAVLLMTLIPGTRLQVVVDSATNPITLWDLFSYAGILITILAFIAAFFILFMAFDAFQVSKDIEKNKETLRENKRLISDHRDELGEISSNIVRLKDEGLRQQRLVSLNGLFIGELSGLEGELAVLKTKVNLLLSKAELADKASKLGSNLAEDGRRRARLGALSYLANGAGLFADHAEDSLQSSVLELTNSVLNAGDESTVVEDATILLLLHVNDLVELEDKVLETIDGIVDKKELKTRGLLF